MKKVKAQPPQYCVTVSGTTSIFNTGIATSTITSAVGYVTDNYKSYYLKKAPKK